MLLIHKITSDSTVDFAAQELQKYLRMMMPECGDVRIDYAPDAKDGFRLGLMQDLSLDVSDVADTALDDLLYVDTDEHGGIIAGDNPRSVLLAVYEFFRQNGCRWLFPGVDGEKIPMRQIRPVRYRHAPSCRYRGPCIEGAISQELLLSTIDFLPKVGMNVFMMQFFVPTVFYTRYYTHARNTVLSPEPVSAETMLQWKTAAESEMAKRGIEFHDVGHGFTVAPFGIDVSSGWTPIEDTVTEENRKYLALLGGERTLYKGVALNTQFCMSSAEARKKIADYVADYAEKHPNASYIHVWLGDSHNNHCECENCARETVSDLYVTLLNDIDAVLTARRLGTRIVFIAYTETSWAPEHETILHPDRFTLMLAPISRSYTRSMTDSVPTLPPFRRNHVTLPTDLDAYMAHFDAWRKTWKGAALCYEYHFWKHQCFDPSGLFLAKRIFEDVTAYKSRGVDGLIACGSQRSYFPSGLAYYVFARKQFDISLSYGEIEEDYFSSAFGDAAESAKRYLQSIAECFGDAYLEGEESEDAARSRYYSPTRAARLRTVPDATKEGLTALREYGGIRPRVEAVSLRLLEEHASYCDLLAEAFAYKADGDDESARAALDRFKEEMSARELRLAPYFDHDLAFGHFARLMKA